MKKIKIFFKSNKNIKNIYTLFTVIAAYYLIITGVYLVFLIPLIVSWITGSNEVAFFNVLNSKVIHRTDISYFTTGDIINSIKLLLISAILLFIAMKLRRIEKNIA